MSQSKTALWLTNDDAVLVAEALGQWAEEYATRAQHAQAMDLIARATAIAGEHDPEPLARMAWEADLP